MRQRGMTFSYPLLATGAALPAQCFTNDQLIAKYGLETNDAWIRERTGIEQRHICEPHETALTLAKTAAVQALERAGVSADKLGLIVVATSTPDLTAPGVSSLLHGALGAGPACGTMDVVLACTGFIGALAVARGLLEGGQGEYALVVGVDVMSRVMNWADRGTCVLFGDGAGAVLIHKTKTDGQPTGLLGTELGADGSKTDLLRTTGGVSTTQTSGVLTMQGADVFKMAVRQLGQAPAILARVGLTPANVNWIVPHQANKRIITAAAEALGVPLEKVVITVDKHANTTAGTIPLALDAAVTDGRIKRGDVLLLQAFGAGMAWGSAVVRW